ncbi:MAG: IS110 family transposase [Gammaproteobacteria bacterium]
MKNVPEPLYVGVDVAKETLEVALGPSGAVQSFANDTEGHDALVAVLKKHTVALIVLEATGGYERGLALALQEAGLPLAIVNPRQARDFARALGYLAKTEARPYGTCAPFRSRRNDMRSGGTRRSFAPRRFFHKLSRPKRVF